MRGKKILIIDDDIFIREIVEEACKDAQAETITAANGHEGLRLFYSHQPDLILLDIVMPYVDGWEVCRQVRQLSNIPIIMFTSLRSDEDIVRGLECGAVEYVTKPFSVRVLIAKVNAVLRYASNTTSLPPPLVDYADDYLMINLKERLLTVNGKPVKLTKTEFKLLAFMLSNAGLLLTFQQILENVWGWAYQDSIEYVHVYVSKLRQKIELDPKKPTYFLTEYGVGYRFMQQL